MKSSKFIVGIDLGTTNTVLAAALRASRDPLAELAVVGIRQPVGPGVVDTRVLLPSALYAPGVADAALASYAASIGETWIVGEAAKSRAAEVAGRAVLSAKSWLPHARVDRLAPILPWGIDDHDVPRISPVDASAAVLRQLRRAWDELHPDAPLAEQALTLTVPASFDEAARALTLEAASRAGFSSGTVRLLEEPQAAFADWMRVAGNAGLASLLDLDDAGAGSVLVLVCDVGGGTTDLSLVRVRRDPEAPLGIGVDRVAVGDHLLLGGDNLDLAIAHRLESQLASPSEPHLPPARFSQLVSAARSVKERMLADSAIGELPVTLLGAGSRLVGGQRRATLSRALLDELVAPFFPDASLHAARTPSKPRAGLLSHGLPYAQDPAITRHVATFLARHLPIGKQAPPLALLLNGGVFRAPALVARMADVLANMLGKAPYLLPHSDPDLAVARGAVAHALSLTGVGRRIGGGSARSFHVAVATDAADRALVCVLPRGARSGDRLRVPDRSFLVTLGKLARYDLYASSGSYAEKAESLGDVRKLPDDPDAEGLVALPPLVARILAKSEHVGSGVRESIVPGSLKGEAARRAEQLPVALEAELSEIGTLDLHLIDLADPGRRFRLAFELAEATSATPSTSEAPRPSTTGRVAQAIARIEQAFPPTSKLAGEIDSRLAKDLSRDLEKLLGDRSDWSLDVVRPLFDALRAGGAHRRRSPEHERTFWNLAGYCVRPGFGANGDGQRMADLAPLLPVGLYFPKEAQGWRAWWIAWRRAAPGLDEATQVALRDMLDPFLEPEDVGGGRAPRKKPKNVRAEPLDEVLLLVSSLERVPAERRAALATWILERTWTSKDPNLYAAVGRLAARVPAYASAHQVVSPRAAELLLEQLVRAPGGIASVPYAIAQVARKTGDRGRDVSETARNEALRALTRLGAKAEWSRLVRDVVVDEQSRREALGEALPIGLRLADSP